MSQGHDTAISFCNAGYIKSGGFVILHYLYQLNLAVWKYITW